jgi:hypothetical protein
LKSTLIIWQIKGEMESEKDDSNCNEQTVDTVVDGDVTFPEHDIENDSQGGDKVSITREENEFDNDTSTFQPQSELDHVSNRRQSISKVYLDACCLVETKFIGHKQTPIPIKDDGGGFDVFFAATLPMNDKDGDVLLMECGDCFNDYIFMVCIQAAKDTDLLFLYVKKSWLDKCPPESELLTYAMPDEEQKTLEGNFIC